MSKTQEIEAALTAAFTPRELIVEDDSESHRGHGGYQEGGESHYNIRIRSEVFEGKNRLARHRAVHSALGPELVARIHAIALDLDV
jgi:BolA protein